eukprot:TRINITY_DN5253_c0_g2_i1.p1 TRINITY_DN5253_c0_g2~~TRINITY_DN5253_c0_g2_i1.p1  ORF type:complete len:322 (+),score=31.46 TRINITY_DN5253_c0_g2_i1:193-1158(+)
MEVSVVIIEAKNLIAADSNGLSDPYVNVRALGKEEGEKQRTKVIPKTLSPVWNEKFALNLYDKLSSIIFHVWDHDKIGSNDPLGNITVNMSSYYNVPLNQPIDLWLKLHEVPHGDLHVTITKTRFTDLPIIVPLQYIAPDPAYFTLPYPPTIFYAPAQGYGNERYPDYYWTPQRVHGSYSAVPSDVLLLSKKFQQRIGNKRSLSIHGPEHIVCEPFVNSVNNLLNEMMKSAAVKCEYPVFAKKVKKSGTTHYKGKVTAKFQEHFEQDFLSALLNLFEIWGWRFEKQYDEVLEFYYHDGQRIDSSIREVFIFRTVKYVQQAY